MLANYSAGSAGKREFGRVSNGAVRPCRVAESKPEIPVHGATAGLMECCLCQLLRSGASLEPQARLIWLTQNMFSPGFPIAGHHTLCVHTYTW